MVDTPLPGSMPRRRYRRWDAEEKRSICQQTRAPGISVAQVARRHGLNANLIFKCIHPAWATLRGHRDLGGSPLRLV
jgi:transposase-like protein